MKIIIGKRKSTLDDFTFEKILWAAKNTLERIEKEEGFLPPTENVALKTTMDLLWRLSEKTITKAEDAE